jgi:hypothetical protein
MSAFLGTTVLPPQGIYGFQIDKIAEFGYI